VQFGPPLSLDDLDLAEARFEGCLFRLPALRGADFSASAFRDCRFEPARFASCTFAEAHFDNCSLFDVAQKKGCIFAFCDVQAAEMAKCNFATNSFERCDLYDLKAVECSFRGAQFDRSTFSKPLSRRSVLTKVAFDACNLS